MNLKIGDWVRPRDVSTDAPDYDEGEIISVGLGDQVEVLWTVAKTTYSEMIDNLVKL